MNKPDKTVDPSLYDHDYYLKGNVGFEEFQQGLEHSGINSKFQDVLQCCDFSTPKNVLDIGCGRGDLVYYSARAGAKALGIDYSAAAIDIANSFKERLAEPVKSRMSFLNIDALDLKADGAYDYVLLVEVWEHMYDHQLTPLLNKIFKLLKPNGSLIITTPNGFYQDYLYPVKRVTNIPFNLVKLPLRILRGKWKPESFSDFLKHVFKVKAFDNPFMDKTHVNVSTPVKIRRMLEKVGLEVSVKCWDPSKNILSLLLSRWAGREMLVTARKPQ